MPFEAADAYGPADKGARRQAKPLRLIPPLRRNRRSRSTTTPPPTRTRNGRSTRSARRDWQIVEQELQAATNSGSSSPPNCRNSASGCQDVLAPAARVSPRADGPASNGCRTPRTPSRSAISSPAATDCRSRACGTRPSSATRSSTGSTPTAATTRNLFDSRTIAPNGGTDRFQRTGPRLQYAAVAIQYFTSAIVVAEDQPNPTSSSSPGRRSKPSPTRPSRSSTTSRCGRSPRRSTRSRASRSSTSTCSTTAR